MRPYYEDGAITIYHGDCREIVPTLSANAIVTDPPYPGEYLSLLAECWNACFQVISEPGWAFVMSGQFYLPEVMAGLERAGWRYWWTGCFHVAGPRVAIWPRGISAAWKPLLIYGKAPHAFKHWKPDLIRS